jgi:hypothetical protein
LVRCASRVALVIALTANAPAFADSASAEASFERGRSLLEVGNTREACAAFQASLDDEFAYGTLYNLAGCHDRLGNLATAWRLYVRLEQEDTNPGRRERSRELASKLWPRVPKLIVSVATPPAQLVVRVDGDEFTNRLNKPLPVDPGEHIVVSSAPGFREWRTSVKVEVASAELRVAIELEPEDVPVREPAQPKVVEYRRQRLGHRTAAKVLLVASPIGLGITIGFGLYQKSKYDAALRRIEEGGPGTIVENNEAANDAVMMNRYVGTSLFIATVACATAGLVLYVKSKTVVLTPVATPHGGAVGFSGSF